VQLTAPLGRRTLSAVNRLVPAFALLLAGCASNRGLPARVGSSLGARTPETAAVEPQGHDPEAGIAEDVVARAALPFHGVRLRDKQPLSPEELHDELLEAHAVCIGEDHDNPHDHYAELATLIALAERAPMKGRELGLGMEMFEQQFQQTIDRFLSGRVDEDQFLEKTDYYERWGFSFSFYRPMLEAALEHGVSVVALNGRREMVRAVAKKGLSALTPADERKIGDVDVDDDEHRAMFERTMVHHPHHPGNPKRLYLAQVVRDESMAQAAYDWLSKRHPARLLVIVAGSAHCHETAVPARLRRRLPGRVVSVKPIIKRAEEALPESRLDGYDYAFVMAPDA
jgi:uncharacterized iron-regulated protein